MSLRFGLLLLLCQFSGFARADVVPFKDAYQDGYVFVSWSTYSDDDLSKMLDRVKLTGARHITFPYFGCQTSITSNDVGACSVGTQEQVVRSAKLAVAKGFGITFLPIVVTPKWEWRGTFEPTDIDAWFASYKVWLKSLADIANELGASEFIVGSEFSKIYEYESEWSDLLTEFHGIFKGPLIVTVNWGKLDYRFWEQADAIGISNYYPLSQDDAPTQKELDQGMQANRNTVLKTANKYNRPLYITEFGFPSTKLAAKTPWQAQLSDGLDPDLQKRCFDSFRKVWGGDRTLVRSLVWATGDLKDPNYNFSFETIGKPAESSVMALFSARAKLAKRRWFHW